MRRAPGDALYKVGGGNHATRKDCVGEVGSIVKKCGKCRYLREIEYRCFFTHSLQYTFSDACPMFTPRRSGWWFAGLCVVGVIVYAWLSSVAWAWSLGL